MPERAAFRLALCNEVVRELTFPEQCDLAARLGYDALEVAPFTFVDDPRELQSQDVRRLKKMAEDAGIGVSSLHWLLSSPPGLSITTADVEVRRRTLQVMEALVNVCAELGGSVLVHGSPAQREVSREDPEGDAQRASEAFARVADVAQAAGVTYCIEPLSPQETVFVNTVAEAEDIVARVGSPALRTMLDTRAARLSESDPVAEVLEKGLSAGTIAHVHVNDSSKLAPGQGEDTFAEVFEVLLRLGYRGTVAVEPFVYEPSGVASAARSIGYVQGIVEGLMSARTALAG